MTKLLIALPCTAQELENALHAVCDQGLWDAKVYADNPEGLAMRGSNYGMECDRKLWLAFHEWVKEQIKERNKKQ